MVWTLSFLGCSRPAVALDKDLLYEHIRESYRIPDKVDLRLGQLKPSEVPGFNKAELRMGRGPDSQTHTLYISKDKRFYLLGTFMDLTVHPIQERLKKLKLKGAPVRGNPNAPVTLVEYTDFQCPYCAVGYRIVRDRILKEYPDKVKWVYKSFPLRSIHPWAEPAAIAVECAKLQGNDQFWKMHDAIFDNQRNIQVHNADDKFLKIAEEAGVETTAFQACYDGKKTLQTVRKDLVEAEELGLSSTPSFLVDGRLVAGADYGALKQAVEKSLRHKKKAKK